MGKYTQDEVYAITHPNEVLNSHKDKLEKMYIEDYGRKHIDLVRERMHNTAYMFDSTPDITYEFVVNNGVLMSDEKFNKLEEFYKDFIKTKKEAEKKSEYAIFLNICKHFKLDEKTYRKYYHDLVNLPIQAYVKEFIPFLSSEEQNMGEEQLKQVYLNKCEELQIKPITNPNTLKKIILENMNIDEKVYNYILFSKSLFGKYAKRKLEIKLGIKITIDKVIDYYTSIDPFCISNKKTLVFIPMIKTYQNGGKLNTIFLHENRHAIESNGKGFGIDVLFMPHLDILNELRTELKAMEDQERVPKMFNVVEREITDNYTLEPYLLFIEEVQELFKQYGHIFNECAITNNIRLLQKYFGIRELKKMNDLLYNEFHSCVNQLESGSKGIDIDCKDIKLQTEKLLSIAKSKRI